LVSINVESIEFEVDVTNDVLESFVVCVISVVLVSELSAFDDVVEPVRRDVVSTTTPDVRVESIEVVVFVVVVAAMVVVVNGVGAGVGAVVGGGVGAGVGAAVGHPVTRHSVMLAMISAP